MYLCKDSFSVHLTGVEGSRYYSYVMYSFACIDYLLTISFFLSLSILETSKLKVFLKFIYTLVK